MHFYIYIFMISNLLIYYFTDIMGSELFSGEE